MISTLDDYLRSLLRLDFNISEEALYVKFVAGIKSTPLCHYITHSQTKLPERDCQYIIQQLTQISGFNLQDFSEYPIFAQYAKTEKQS